MRVMIAEDQPVPRKLLTALLAKAGCTVVAQHVDGESAALWLMENADRIDGMFLDIQMPGISGLQVAAMHPNIPAVYVTSAAEFEAKAWDQVAVDFILKPITPGRLQVALERLRRRIGVQEDSGEEEAAGTLGQDPFLPEGKEAAGAPTEIFPWNEIFATGIPSIDEQHRHLIGLLNQFARNVVLGEGGPEARTALDALSEALDFHFRCEESIWKAHLPGHLLVEDHLDQHRTFSGQLVEMRAEAAPSIQAILAFLTPWLTRHILRRDRHLAQLVRDLQAGATPEEAQERAARNEGGVSGPMADVLVGLYEQFSTNAMTLLREADSHRRANAALEESRTQMAAILHSSFDLVWSVEPEAYRLTLFNHAMADYLKEAFEVHPVLGMEPRDIFPGPEAVRAWEGFYRRALREGPFATEYQAARGGRTLQLNFAPLLHDGAPFGVAILGKDITERKAAESSIRQLAFYDPLTGLPNRRLLTDRLHQAIASSERNGSHSAILSCGLDGFKFINEARGHACGDQVLVEAARRLERAIRSNDTAARLGNDEFILVLNDLDRDPARASGECLAFCDRIQAAIGHPFELRGQAYHLTVSLGVRVFCGRGHTAQDLLQQVDAAMHQAKGGGRNLVRFYESSMVASAESRLFLAEALRAGFPDQFQVHYQLQVQGDGRPLGAEALLRWRHPERGHVSPAEFIPVAEETGQILPIGAWVLDTACRQIKRWEASPLTRDLTVAVNVSAQQLSEPDFVEHVLSALATTGADPSRLKLELTESMLVFDMEGVIAKMTALKNQGVTFALDDFGTGYSSLSALKRLPLDQVKIDRSFVRDILVDPNDSAIARTVIALGRTLGLAVVAEGVETREQWEVLAREGCDGFQGFHFSRPVPVEDLEALLAWKGAGTQAAGT